MGYFIYRTPRGCGKTITRLYQTAEMIDRSGRERIPIVVCNEADKNRLIALAKGLDLDIPEIIVVPPKPIKPSADFDNNLWLKKAMGERILKRETYLVSIYKLEEDNE